jgi:hypothetical protein
MRTTVKLGLTALIATFLLASAINTASARNLSLTKEEIRVTWNSLEFESALATIRCRFTMEGSFHSRTIAKVLGALIGVITRAAFKTESCANARATASRLPWHITYEGFLGNLPRITGLLLLVREYLYRFERVLGTAVECTYGTPEDRLLGTANLNAELLITNLVPEPNNRLTLRERRNDPFNTCTATIRMVNGTATEGQVVLLIGSSRIYVTLI